MVKSDVYVAGWNPNYYNRVWMAMSVPQNAYHPRYSWVWEVEILFQPEIYVMTDLHYLKILLMTRRDVGKAKPMPWAWP